jgi:hypothetical protein
VRRPLAVATLLVVLAAVALLVVDALAPTWSGLPPASCLPRCYCEAPRAAGVLQLANTWSNLGFIFVGGLIVGARRDPLFGWATVFLGPASMALHATLTFPGQLVDILSMYLVPTLLIARNLAAPAWAYIAANAALFAAQWAWPEARRWLFAVLVVAAAVSELRVRRRRRFLLVSIALLLASFGVWALDAKDLWCWPTSLLQGHAVWHLGCAAAVGVLYLYLHDEPASG